MARHLAVSIPRRYVHNTSQLGRLCCLITSQPLCGLAIRPSANRRGNMHVGVLRHKIRGLTFQSWTSKGQHKLVIIAIFFIFTILTLVNYTIQIYGMLIEIIIVKIVPNGIYTFLLRRKSGQNCCSSLSHSSLSWLLILTNKICADP